MLIFVTDEQAPDSAPANSLILEEPLESRDYLGEGLVYWIGADRQVLLINGLSKESNGVPMISGLIAANRSKRLIDQGGSLRPSQMRVRFCLSERSPFVL